MKTLATFVGFLFISLTAFSSLVFADLKAGLSFVGKSSKTTGPNCWNYALYSAGLVHSLRNVEADEFDFFIHSKLCQLIDDSKPVVAGQIGAIQDIVQGKPIQNHAFIFLSRNEILTKNGPYIQAPYQRSTLSELFQIPSYQLNSTRILQRYSCGSLNHYLSVHPNLNKKLLRIYHLTKKFELEYQKVTFEKIELDINFKTFIISEIETLIFDLSGFYLSDEDRFLKEVIATHLSGMSGQIYYTYASPIMDQFISLSGKVKQIQ